MKTLSILVNPSFPFLISSFLSLELFMLYRLHFNGNNTAFRCLSPLKLQAVIEKEGLGPVMSRTMR
jgi:hypothetical protein